MTYDLLIEIAWKSAVTSGLALLLLALLRNRSAGERSWVGHAGLIVTLLLPLAVIGLPKWEVETPAALAQFQSAGQSPAYAGVDPVPVMPGATIEPPAATASGPTLDLQALSMWTYAFGAALLLLVTIVAVLRLFALRGRATVLVEQEWLSALAHAQRRLDFKSGTALLVSSELSSPVSWGVLRPIILLNEEAVTSPREAEAIIAHELAHVARLDWAKLLIARAATALFWFNPLVWLLAKQCHQLREEAADDAVLRGNVESTDYAALLVGAARHETRAFLLAANGVAPGKGSLKRRITRVLDARLPRAPARAAWASICSVGAMVIAAPLVVLTPVTPLPAAPQRMMSTAIEEMPATAAAAPVRRAVPARAAPDAPVAAKAVHLAAVTPAGSPRRAVAPRQPVLSPTVVLEHRPARAPKPARPARAPRDMNADDLVTMRIHGITPEFIREVTSVGPRLATLSSDQLVSLGIHGVSAREIRELAALGYRNISYDELIASQIHGVTPAFIREMAAAGYRGLDLGTLTAMKIHGVTPAYAREMASAGYGNLNADRLIELRIHGVSARAKRVRARARATALPDTG